MKLLIPRQDDFPILARAAWIIILRCLVTLTLETADTRVSFLSMVCNSLKPSATTSDLQNVVVVATLIIISVGSQALVTRDPRDTDILFRVQYHDSERIFIIPGVKDEVCGTCLDNTEAPIHSPALFEAYHATF